MLSFVAALLCGAAAVFLLAIMSLIGSVTHIIIGDFSRLPTRCKFIAMMPQWDFLNFLAAQGAQERRLQIERRTVAVSRQAITRTMLAGEPMPHSVV